MMVALTVTSDKTISGKVIVTIRAENNKWSGVAEQQNIIRVSERAEYVGVEWNITNINNTTDTGISTSFETHRNT